VKRVGDIMKEMGFREDASDEAKKAFIRHLIQAATKSEVPSLASKAPRPPAVKAAQAPEPREEQLSFDFDEPLLKCDRKSAG
jgi:hypothetical protein